MPTESVVGARRSAAIAARAAEPQSWGESLQRYNSGRVAAPSSVPLVVPTKGGLYNATTKPVEFNPLRQTYADPARETATRERETAASVARISSAQHRVDGLANHKGYDLLSGAVRTTNARVAQDLHREDTKHRTKVEVRADGTRAISFVHPPSHPPLRDYNILTNTPAFEGAAARLAAADVRVPPVYNRAVLEQREFNIVNNRYQFEPHEPRAERERAVNDAGLRDKYFQSSHYDPIALQFVHPAEERRYQLAKAVASAAHGQGQLRNLPPRIKRSEGQCYDVIAPGVVKDAAQLAATYEVPQERARASRQLRYEAERASHTRDLALDQRQVTRSNARVSVLRTEQQVKRGYDPISNEPLQPQSSSATAGLSKIAPPSQPQRAPRPDGVLNLKSPALVS